AVTAKMHPMQIDSYRKPAGVCLGIASLALAVFFFALPARPQDAVNPFLEKPYLQLGDAPGLSNPESLLVVWQSSEDSSGWKVEVKSGVEWKSAETPVAHRVAVQGVDPHIVWTARLSGLDPGAKFDYRVLHAGNPVFTANGEARKSASESYRFVAFGDCAAGTPAEKAIAYQAYKARPDFLFIAGDIVYTRGRIPEYRAKFFPVYNADKASPETGAPLTRSILFMAAPGNHDLASRDIGKLPDSLAYFYYWFQPLNGPPAPVFATLVGDGHDQNAFKAAASDRFPRMANFSFNYGNAHWTILDSNPYADWSKPELKKWVANDLASARNATWRFVGFHHPGFNSSKSHFHDQQMRVLAPVFEKGHVDVVFAGHVHNYQRSHPLRFQPHKFDFSVSRDVDGKFTIDRKFDGVSHTKPAGVIYLVTGGGGANLYNPEQQDNPGSWQPFTAKFVSKVHSLTETDVDGRTLKFRQISDRGDVVDSFTVTK
ncbi:MAG: metallophosphoesterase, partial [Bryobacteraceae bacterium]